MSHEPAPPPANRTGAVAANPDRRRRPAWLIPLLGLLVLLALALLALALYALLHHSGKKSVTAPVAAASPTGASTPSGLPASPSPGTASGEAAPGGGSGSAPASAGSGAAGGSGAGLPAAGSGTGSAAGGAALVGGGGVAAKAATGIEAGSAAGGSAAKGAGSAAAGTAQGTVLFASDSAALDADARQVLAAAAARIKAQHPSKVTVTGYTDVVGGPANQQQPVAAAGRGGRLSATHRARFHPAGDHRRQGPGRPGRVQRHRGWAAAEPPGVDHHQLAPAAAPSPAADPFRTSTRKEHSWRLSPSTTRPV
jgi:hypothetical protein